MKNNQKNSTVIIFGTMHLETKEFSTFIGNLVGIIKEINPEVICAELSPEQLDGSQPCNSKPEQRDAVLPIAKELNIKIVPIQPSVKKGIEVEKRYNDCVNDLKTREPSKFIIEYMDYLADREYELWKDFLRKPDCIERIQLNEFHIFSEARDNLVNKYFPQYAKFFDDWNEEYLHNIEKKLFAITKVA